MCIGLQSDDNAANSSWSEVVKVRKEGSGWRVAGLRAGRNNAALSMMAQPGALRGSGTVKLLPTMRRVRPRATGRIGDWAALCDLKMAIGSDDFERLLEAESRQHLRTALASRRAALTLPQAQRLKEFALSLAPAPKSLRIAVVHTYTSELLDPWLDLACAVEGLQATSYHAPYGLALQEAVAASSLVEHKPDITLLLLQRSDLHPDLLQPLSPLTPLARDRLRNECVDRLRDIVSRFRAQPIGQLVLTLLPGMGPAALGLFDAQAAASERAWWSTLESEIADWLRSSVPASLLLDLGEVIQDVGRREFFDRRYWYSSRYPFTPSASLEVARRVAAVGALLKEPRAKVLVLDADNTLWGGVIGEDGLEGIRLGPDYPGSVYVDFQRRIRELQQRGLILALCSKNNPGDLDQVLTTHRHQVLRHEHFAARRVNWLPKPDNLISLSEELNLGLDSFVFVDDSDHECAAVRHRLPQVEVIQVPARAVDIPFCLDRVARLETLSLTEEDLAKTTMYAQERQRRELLERSGDGGGGDYLTKLAMHMRVGCNQRANIPRLSQLTQKTNQFNLTTRRYGEQEISALMAADDWLAFDFSLADTFGDSGLVGLALLQIQDGGRARLDSFLMSCRVIGRHAESAFLESVLRRLVERGVHEVVAEYLPTAKNALVKDFLPQRGFVALSDSQYRRDLRTAKPASESEFPIAVTLLTSSSSEPALCATP